MSIDPNEFERLKMQERARLEAERELKAEEARRQGATVAKGCGWFILIVVVATVGLMLLGRSARDRESARPIPGKAFTSLEGLRIQVDETVACDRGLKIEVNDDYTWRSGPTTLRAGERRSIPWGAFTTDKGERFNVIRYAPKRVVLVCQRSNYRDRISIFRFN